MKDLFLFSVFFKDQKKQSKKIKMSIKFPISTLFRKNNYDMNEKYNNSEFLLQVIIWKANFTKHFKNVISYMFSFDIYNKNENRKLIFRNLPTFSFIFNIPLLTNNINYNKDSTTLCQFWDKNLSKWKKNGCKFKGYNPYRRTLICSCNHLTEFRTISKRHLEELTHNNVIYIANIYFFY